MIIDGPMGVHGAYATPWKLLGPNACVCVASSVARALRLPIYVGKECRPPASLAHVYVLYAVGVVSVREAGRRSRLGWLAETRSTDRPCSSTRLTNMASIHMRRVPGRQRLKSLFKCWVARPGNRTSSFKTQPCYRAAAACIQDSWRVPRPAIQSTTSIHGSATDMGALDQHWTHCCSVYIRWCSS